MTDQEILDIISTEVELEPCEIPSDEDIVKHIKAVAQGHAEDDDFGVRGFSFSAQSLDGAGCCGFTKCYPTCGPG
jgi:hypothetical protein